MKTSTLISIIVFVVSSYYSHQLYLRYAANNTVETMSDFEPSTDLPEICGRLPPRPTDYQPQGQMIKLDSTDRLYETGSISSTMAILAFYDIWALSPNLKQNLDRIGEAAKVHVVMPDFYRGDAWTTERAQAGEDNKPWMRKVCNRSQLEEITTKTVNYLKSKGVKKVAIFGWCWGGMQAVKLLSEAAGSYKFDLPVVASGAIHGVNILAEDAKDFPCPFINLPSKAETTQMEFMNALPDSIKAESVYKRYDTMFHGFAGSRCNWDDEENAKHAEEALTLMANFLKKHLQVSNVPGL